MMTLPKFLPLAAVIAVASSSPASVQAHIPVPVTQSVSLTASTRAEAVEAIAVAAEQRYSDEAGGRALAAYLRSRLFEGRYDALTDPVEFAAALTADMRAATPDVHLRATYDPNRDASAGRQVVRAPGGGAAQNVARNDGRSIAAIARDNFGFQQVERLRGNVGYLRLSRFTPLALSEPAATAAMGFLANSDAVIVDLRGVPGGSPDLVRQLISYFTGPEPVRLMASRERASGQVDEIWSLAQTPNNVRLTGRPLFILQDADTASAAEMFGYMAQRQGLGMVVGETSAGAGNGGGLIGVGSDIFVFLPQRRIIDGPGWEALGVKPDIEVAPELALGTAHMAALERLAAMAADESLRRERLWALEYARALEQPVEGAWPELSAYAAGFGRRRFETVGDALAVTPAAGARQVLVRLRPDVFRSESARYTFGRDAGGRVSNVTVEPIEGETSHAPRDP